MWIQRRDEAFARAGDKCEVSGKITLPVFLTKTEAVKELRKRPDHYYTKKQDYKLVCYAAVQRAERKEPTK